MAYSFDGSNDYMFKSLVGQSYQVPTTLSCWFSAGNTAVQMGMVNLNYSAGARWNAIELATSGAVVARAPGSVAGTAVSATTTTTCSLNTWNHAAGVFTGEDSRTAYLNAGGKNTDTSAGGLQTVFQRINFGARVRAGTTPDPSTYYNGKLAEIGIWNVALTDAEISTLASGVKPIYVRPASIIAYIPLVRDVTDYVDANAITQSGGVSLVVSNDHSRRYG